MRGFEFHAPTQIIFGAGSISRAGVETARWGLRVLVVTGLNSAQATGHERVLRDRLQVCGVVVGAVGRIGSDPKVHDIDDVARQARRARCEVIVALGGGSVIDAAKAAAAGIALGPVGGLIGADLPPDADLLPIIAIPTTAGSGAEVTKGAIVTDTTRNLRAGIRGPALFPRVAIIDPELTATMPPAVRADTAFDATAHAIEALVARRANPLTDALARQVLATVADSLPQLKSGQLDAGTRHDLCLASTLAGMCVANASTCLPHRLQQALGSVGYAVGSHGRGLSALYPAWLTLAQSHASEQFDSIADLLGSNNIHDAVGALKDQLGMKTRLRDLLGTPDDIELALDRVTGNIDNDPIVEANSDIMRSIYLKAW